MIGDRKISIVTAYYNRRKLFHNTLKTIEQSKYKDLVEVIVVDDNSINEEMITDFPNLFDIDIKVIRIEQKDKWWKNPCIPFNIGFKEAKSDIVIIQNPECLHMGDIIEYTLNNIKENLYLNFGAYSVDKSNTEQINNLDFNTNIQEQISNIITPTNTGPILNDGTNVWYNHSIYRPIMLHFCSAITKKDLYELGGFDERFARGVAYDDNEFLFRIKCKNMEIKIVDNPFVIHQNHYTDTNYGANSERVRLTNINLNLLNETMRNKYYNVKKNNRYYR